MLKNLNKKFLTLLLSSTIIVSCSTNIDNISNISTKLNDKKSFGIKSNSIIDYDQLTYTGNWSVVGNRKQSTATIDNKNDSIVYNGNWIMYNNNSTTEGNYTYTNNTVLDNSITSVNNDSTSIVYTGNWLTYSNFKYSDPTSSKYIVTNKETDINKLKYTYYPFQEDLAWSDTMQYWNTYNNGGFNYTYSNYASAKVEIPFTGTNITLFQYKAPNRGICNIKIYDDSFNIVRNFNIDNYDSTSHINKTVVNGLKNGNYKLVISRTGEKNPSSSGYIYDFAKIEVYPSIEYKFKGTNISYNTFTANNCGKVAITIDNDKDNTEIVDLYNENNIYQNIYTKNNLANGEHTITIDSLQERNPLSSGYRMSIYKFNKKSESTDLSAEFNGTFLNLKLVGTPNSGKADLYIDDILNREIDMYSENSSYYSINIDNLSDTNHVFKLVYKNTKNNNSTDTRINFDGYTTNKASYTFNGVGIKYFADKLPNQGKVDIWLDGSKYGTYDLYSSNIRENQEIVNISGLVNGSHTIDIVPAGIKAISSSNYFININHLDIIASAEPKPKIVTWLGYDDTGTPKIYAAPSDGSDVPTLISGSLSDNNSPQISGDGSIVTWSGNDGSGIYKIYTAPSDGSDVPTLISGSLSDNNSLQISGDGSIVTWSGNDGSGISKIYAAPSNGSTSPTLISGSLIDNYEAQISGDGSIVTWSGNDGSGIYKIYTAPSDGSDVPTLISGSLSGNDSPQISGDGSIVTWRNPDITGSKIYTAR